MKKGISITVALVLVLFSVIPVFAVNTVTDQTYGNLYEQFNDLEDEGLGVSIPSIAKAVQAGIFRGDSSGNFQPYKPTTGTELILVMLRLLNLDNNLPNGSADVSSVPVWAQNDVGLAIEKGLMSQNDPVLTNGITRELTRAEALVFIAKALNIQPDSSASPFSDSSDPYITALYKLGIVKGYGNGTVGSDKPLTRTELAILIDRMLDLQ
ncbi:MAG: S-layer homology domain-containing protein [Vulcanibacillus sp.]